MNASHILSIAFLALLVTVAVAIVLLWQRRTHRPRDASEFAFSSAQDEERQKFVYTIAGLIKAATGLDTRIVALGKYEHLEIEVYRGMRCVGVVSVVPSGELEPINRRIQSVSKIKADKHARTAYVVSGRTFTDDERRRAQRAGVTLLDGAALQRIKSNVMHGYYDKRGIRPPEPEPKEAKRWQPPGPGAPVLPAAVVDSAKSTQPNDAKPPWVEFR